MTRLYIDKREIAPVPSDMHSLDQVLKLVESNHLSGNTVIRQVQVDGVPLMQDDQETDLAGDLCDRETIEIFTGSLREVAADSIREAVTYLERAEAAIPSLSSSLRVFAEPEASSNLRQLYEGIYFINLLLQRLEQAFQLPIMDLKVGTGNARDCCVKLAGLLQEIVEAHEKKDFGLLADLLEYEIGPLIPAFKETFEAINSRILVEH